MDANKREFSGPSARETFEIVGSAFEVLNTLGSGLLEKPYENALIIELHLRNLHCDQQKVFPVLYKGHNVGTYIPDLVVSDSVIVDTKVIDHITDIERAQILNYLKITKLKVGVILNFKRPKLEWERIVLETKS